MESYQQAITFVVVLMGFMCVATFLEKLFEMLDALSETGVYINRGIFATICLLAAIFAAPEIQDHIETGHMAIGYLKIENAQSTYLTGLIHADTQACALAQASTNYSNTLAEVQSETLGTPRQLASAPAQDCPVGAPAKASGS